MSSDNSLSIFFSKKYVLHCGSIAIQEKHAFFANFRTASILAK